MRAVHLAPVLLFALLTQAVAAWPVILFLQS
jgi:hypothetical protein